MSELKAGDAAPDFLLPTGGGATTSLAALRGSKIVLYFYPSDGSETCTKEASGFTQLHHQFIKSGTQVIGISPDSLASHEKFKRKRQLAQTLAADEAKIAIQAYGVWKEKTLYGRTYMGVERTTLLIDGDGIVARIWRKVRVNGHAEEVLAAAQAL